MLPLGELVAPGGGELRPAQALRILRGEGERDRAVRQFEPPLRSDPARTFARPQSRLSSPDSPFTITSRTSAIVSPTSAMRSTALPARDACAEHQRPHPFGAGARLAGAAAAEHQPGRPVAGGGSWSGRAVLTRAAMSASAARCSSGVIASNAAWHALSGPKMRSSRRANSALSQAGSSRKSCPSSCSSSRGPSRPSRFVSIAFASPARGRAPSASAHSPPSSLVGNFSLQHAGADRDKPAQPEIERLRSRSACAPAADRAGRSAGAVSSRLQCEVFEADRARARSAAEARRPALRSAHRRAAAHRDRCRLPTTSVPLRSSQVSGEKVSPGASRAQSFDRACFMPNQRAVEYIPLAYAGLAC